MSGKRTKGQDGFTIVELMIALAISVLVVAGVTTLYAQLFSQYKQESRITGTDIGSAIGLNYLVDDIRAAGYGLPWNISNNVTYDDYSTVNGNSIVAPQANDDGPTPPRAIVPISGGANGACTFGDYLVIKSQSAAVGDSAAGKSMPLTSNGALNGNAPWTTGLTPAQCANDPENFCGSDYVIVLKNLDTTRDLESSGPQGWWPTYANASTVNYAPSTTNATYMIYGVASNTDAPNGNLHMPYNRADYFIAANARNGQPAQNVWDKNVVTVPQGCAQNTGELIKAAVKQSDGTFNYYPVLNCAATMKVNFLRANGAVADAATIAANDPTAAQIRSDILQVRVFILAQEGQMDPSYTVPAAQQTIWLGDCSTPPVANGVCTSYTLTGDQVHYKWRVYKIMEKPFNLGAQ